MAADRKSLLRRFGNQNELGAIFVFEYLFLALIMRL